MNWQALTLQDKATIDKALQRHPFTLSDYNFTNLWMWHASRNYQIAWIDDFLCIKYTASHQIICPSQGQAEYVLAEKDAPDTAHCDERVALAGGEEPDMANECYTADRKHIEEVNKVESSQPHKKWASCLRDVYLYPIGAGSRKAVITKIAGQSQLFYMRAIPEDAISELEGHQWTITPEVGHFDYIYTFEGLLLLPGNQHQAKRNLINQFIRNFKFEYRAISSDLIPALMEMEMRWFTEHANKSRHLLEEHHASLRALKYFETLNIIGAALLVQGEIAAFTIAEHINPQMLVIHVEKALHAYKGAYAMINQQLLRHVTPTLYVNREEDLGFSNLAQGKRFYHPLRLEKKFQLCAMYA